MLERTHIPEARWFVVQAVDKKKARLNCIHHLLEQARRFDGAGNLLSGPQIHCAGRIFSL